MAETLTFEPLIRGRAEDWDEDEIALLALLALADVEPALRLWRRIAPRRFRTLLDDPTFDEATQRYAGLSDEQLRALLYAAVLGAIRLIERETAPLLTGNVEIDQWQAAVVDLLRSLALALFALGRGGFTRMTADDFAAVSETLEFQFGKLGAFAGEIEAGTVTPQRVLSRSRLYPQSTAILFHQATRVGHEEAGYTQERRRLRPAEHCSECPKLERLGWQPIGTLPDIGVGTPCLWNCRCVFEWR